MTEHVKRVIKSLEMAAEKKADQFSETMVVGTKSILAIIEAYSALEQRAKSAEAKLLEMDNQNLDEEIKLYRQESIIPKGLNSCTAELVMDFSKALAEKLHRSEQKYGWSDGWKDADWQDKCLADFNHHIDKGDPRDVAAYCAFMWFHGWQTKRLNATAQPVSDGLYRIANHIAGAKNSLPQEWQDWAEEIESDLRKLVAAPGGQ